jgi:cold shock CspA family protein
MEGTMIWFNAEKGFGFIRTENDERLYVAQSGFAPADVPRERCAGKKVIFEREAAEGDARAVNVVFSDTVLPHRARLRHARGGSSR